MEMQRAGEGEKKKRLVNKSCAAGKEQRATETETPVMGELGSLLFYLLGKLGTGIQNLTCLAATCLVKHT